MATYPDDAVFDIETSFSVIGTTQYTNTSTDVSFNLPSSVSFEGEIFAITDGVTQSTSSFYVSNNNSTINFYIPPNAANLTIKTLSIPARFKKLVSETGTFSVTYSNNNPVTNNANNYLIDGVTTSWALPLNSTSTQKPSIFVFVNGVNQSDNSFVFPSSVLGDQGIDIDPPIPAYANTFLDIRTINNSISFTDRCNSMADKKPDKGYTESRKFDVATFESQAGYEKRRLLSRRAKREYQLTYSVLSGVEKQALENFYNERSGTFEDFIFNLSHINEPGTVNVRFEGDLQFNHIGSRGTNVQDQFYSVSIKLKEVYG